MITAKTSCDTISFTFVTSTAAGFRIADINGNAPAILPEFDIAHLAGRWTYTVHLIKATRTGYSDRVEVWTASVPTRTLAAFTVPVNCDQLAAAQNPTSAAALPPPAAVALVSNDNGSGLAFTGFSAGPYIAAGALLLLIGGWLTMRETGDRGRARVAQRNARRAARRGAHQ